MIMKLVGYSCPHCGGVVFDSPEHCVWCTRPYVGVLAVIVRAHHQAKLLLVGRCQNEEELSRCTDRLSAVCQGIALAEQGGMMITEPLVTSAFTDILYEDE